MEHSAPPYPSPHPLPPLMFPQQKKCCQMSALWAVTGQRLAGWQGYRTTAGSPFSAPFLDFRFLSMWQNRETESGPSPPLCQPKISVSSGGTGGGQPWGRCLSLVNLAPLSPLLRFPLHRRNCISESPSPCSSGLQISKVQGVGGIWGLSKEKYMTARRQQHAQASLGQHVERFAVQFTGTPKPTHT